MIPAALKPWQQSWNTPSLADARSIRYGINGEKHLFEFQYDIQQVESYKLFGKSYSTIWLLTSRSSIEEEMSLRFSDEFNDYLTAEDRMVMSKRALRTFRDALNGKIAK